MYLYNSELSINVVGYTCRNDNGAIMPRENSTFYQFKRNWGFTITQKILKNTTLLLVRYSFLSSSWWCGRSLFVDSLPHFIFSTQLSLPEQDGGNGETEIKD